MRPARELYTSIHTKFTCDPGEGNVRGVRARVVRARERRSRNVAHSVVVWGVGWVQGREES